MSASVYSQSILSADSLMPLGYLSRPYLKSDLSYLSICDLAFLFFFVLEMSSHMPSMHSTTQLHPQPHGFSFFYSEI